MKWLVFFCMGSATASLLLAAMFLGKIYAVLHVWLPHLSSKIPSLFPTSVTPSEGRQLLTPEESG